MAVRDFKKAKKVHFIGVGGIGVSAIARMLILEGKKVSGSDRAESEITEELKKQGAKIFIGQKAENISSDTDLVIHTIAITSDNPELQEAKRQKIPCMTYPEVLGIISKDKFTIAVSGAHGKTTTTAMIAKLLIDAKMDPTVIVGSILKDQKSNFIAGKSKYLIAEACEYKRSFLNLTPSILVITNIDDDHLDYYKDIRDIQSAFTELVQKIPASGYIVCDREQPYITDVIKKAKATILDYELFWDSNLALKIPGEHNLANAAAVLAVADILGISRKLAEKSLQEFSGTWRRFEYRGTTKSGATVYDDYGHHPTEVQATLRGARDLFPDKNLVVVFQPHLFSRTKQHQEHFGKVFNEANEIIFAPIYPAREPFDSSISSEMVANEVKKSGGNARVLSTFEKIEKYLTTLGKETIILTMGAGDIYHVANTIVAEK